MAENRRSGINPQAYMGVEASSPPQFVYFRRNPTVDDYDNWRIGTIWMNRATTPQRIWILANLNNHVATWLELLTGTSTPIQFQTGDGNFAFPDINGTLFMPNGTLTTTETAPNVNSVRVNVVNGGDGEILIGQGALPPVWGNLTSVGGSIAILPNFLAPGTINLEAVLAPAATTFTTDAGNASPIANTLNILGDGSAIQTTGAGNTVTINHIPMTVVTDAGNATPAANVLNVIGDGVNIQTTGAGNTVTVSLVGGPIVPFASLFFYWATVSHSSVTGDGTIFTPTFGTMYFDVNHDFDGVSTFTAPRDGIYYFKFQFEIFRNTPTGTQYLQTYIVTPAVTFISNVINLTQLWFSGIQYCSYHEVIVQLNNGDTVQPRFSVSGGTKQVGIGSGYDTNFSGFLIR